MDTFEIRDEEINVEEIMQKIRENIKRRKEKGADPDVGPQILGQPEDQLTLCQQTEQVIDEKKNDLVVWTDEIKRDLDYINNNWNIQNNSYFISSHRPYSGTFLIKGRELVHGEVKRYVDPMIWKQNEFNASVVRTLNEITKKISDISQIVTSASASMMVLNETTRRISEISKRTIEFENTTIGKIRSEIGGKLDEKIELAKTEIGDKVDEQIGLARSEISGKVEEKIELAKTEIGGKVDEQISRIRSEISSKVEGKIGLAKTEIGGKVDEQIGLARSEISSKVEEKIGLAKTEIGGKVDEQIGLARSEIKNEISTQVSSILAAMNQEIENRAWLANILDKKIGNIQNIEASVPTQESELNYFLFEERFRGSRADIKQRQTAFVHYFEGCKNVLDIGCGRGEFLELLRENGIGGYGIDVDGNMIDFCTSKGLNVEKIDAISYLEKIEDKSLEGILLDQVVEHLETDYLIKMLRLCHKKLNFGYHMLIETVNPLSLVSFANFYSDMSHKKPIHPETLKFLMTSVNFREIETRFFSPIPDEMRLRKINTQGVEERDRHTMEVYNYNIDMLNNLLYGPQDYVVIGKK